MSFYSSHESGEDSNNVEKYYEDSVEQEDSSSSIVNEPVAYENFILSNNEDIAHEEISSSASDEYTTLKDIEEDFDSSTIDDVDDADLMRFQFNDAPHALSVTEPCMPMHASKEEFIAPCMHMYASTKASRRPHMKMNASLETTILMHAYRVHEFDRQMHEEVAHNPYWHATMYKEIHSLIQIWELIPLLPKMMLIPPDP